MDEQLWPAERCRIELLPRGERRVVLPRALVDQTGDAGPVALQVGTRTAWGDPVVAGADRDGWIGLSPDLFRDLALPAEAAYQVRAGRRTIRLGPVVGILGAITADQLTRERLQVLQNHLLGVADPMGLFIACDRSAIDPDARLVTGFRFRAHREPCWEEGRFPLPAVLIRRYGIPLTAQMERLRAAGVQVVNERTFHKGEAARWLDADHRLRPYLPETQPLRGVRTVIEMLQRHPVLFLKPVWGSLGDRILRVHRLTGGGYRMEEPAGAAIDCPDPEALAVALKGRLPSPGIAQQGLELATVGGRLIDFRVVVQKDGAGRWGCTGLVARCGTPSLFLSNMATGGFPIPVETGLALLVGDNPARIFRRKLELVDLGLAVAAALEQGGLPLGDLGLDIAYDSSGHPWLIEANNRDPDHNIAWEAGAWPLFFAFRSRPAEHGACLDGFPERLQPPSERSDLR